MTPQKDSKETNTTLINNKTMKKSLFFSLAATALLVSCSDDAVLENAAPVADRFAGVEKVNATFTAVNGEVETRMANHFGLEQNDKVGLAWLEDTGTGIITRDGKAYQNHPLFVEEGMLKPKTSIYVGKYFSYLPYDATVVEPGKINFDLSKQPLVSDQDKAAAASIWISAKETDVTKTGHWDASDRRTEDKAGVDGVFNIYPRQFSNLVKLDLTYKNNQPEATYDLEPAEIYSIEVSLDETLSAAPGYAISAAHGFNKFTYAPVSEVSSDANYSWTNTSIPAGVENKVTGAYLLKNTSSVNTKDATSGAFYFNAMPSESATAASNVVLKVTSDYGVVYIAKPITDVLYTAYTNAAGNKVFGTDPDAKSVTSPKVSVALTNSAISSLGNVAKVVTDVDFKNAVMNGMHVESDKMLQKLLKFYKYKVAKGAAAENVVFNLDGNSANEFILSKESVGLINDINNYHNAQKIVLVGCATHPAPTTTVVLANDGTATDMPKLNFFAAATSLTLRGNWNMGETSNSGVKYVNVSSFENEGTVNFSAGVINNVALSTTVINNKKGGVINVNTIANLRLDATNLGTINIEAGKELRISKNLTNDAKTLPAAFNNGTETIGYINNKGVLATVLADLGTIDNYGIIDRRGGSNAKTYITTNEKSTAFNNAFNASTNKYGTIILDNAFDNDYSVSNTENEGFIKLYLDQTTITNGHVGEEANYVVVGASNTDFKVKPIGRLKYVEFNNTAETVWTSDSSIAWEGVVVMNNVKVNIKKSNTVNSSVGYIKGTVYQGGAFNLGSFTGYLGGAAADNANVLKY